MMVIVYTAGESKLKKATEKKTRIIDEDGLFAIIKASGPESAAASAGGANGGAAVVLGAGQQEQQPGLTQMQEAYLMLFALQQQQQVLMCTWVWSLHACRGPCRQAMTLLCVPLCARNAGC